MSQRATVRTWPVGWGSRGAGLVDDRLARTGAFDEKTAVEPISIGEETVAEKASDLAMCKCIAPAPEGSTP